MGIVWFHEVHVLVRGGAHMLIQCTKALLDKIGVKANELESAEKDESFPACLTAWHAHFVSMNRRKVIVLMNNETRYPVVIYRPVAKDFKQIKSLIKEAIKEALHMEGFSAEVIDHYLELSGDIVFSKTANRRMVAQLNNAIRDVEFMGEYLDESTRIQRYISMNAGRLIQRFEEDDYSYPIEIMTKKLEKLAELKGLQEDVLDIKLYQLNIQIDLEGHEIWRRVLVPSTYSFRHLHNIIQAVFDWHNSHLHEFTIEGINQKPLLVLMDDSPEMMEFIDEEKFTVGQEKFIALEDVLQEGLAFDYMYDFGDGWDHIITVEKIVKGGSLQATYVDGVGQRPPEDVGGAPGFESYLQVMSDTEDPDYESMKIWSESQKERFGTREEINRRLQGIIRGYWYPRYY